MAAGPTVSTAVVTLNDRCLRHLVHERDVRRSEGWGFLDRAVEVCLVAACLVVASLTVATVRITTLKITTLTITTLTGIPLDAVPLVVVAVIVPWSAAGQSVAASRIGLVAVRCWTDS